MTREIWIHCLKFINTEGEKQLLYYIEHAHK